MDARSSHGGPDVSAPKWLLLNTAVKAGTSDRGTDTEGDGQACRQQLFGGGQWECAREGL